MKFLCIQPHKARTRGVCWVHFTGNKVKKDAKKYFCLKHIIILRNSPPQKIIDAELKKVREIFLKT